MLNLKMDATESEVSLTYNLDIDISNIPQNLKFYSDKDMKNRVIIEDNKIKIKDFIGISDESKQQVKTLFWCWPYEMGMSNYEKKLNDIEDSKHMGETFTLLVNIVAKQVIEKTPYLADEVSLGDYVNYDANSNGEHTYITDSSLTGSKESTTFSSKDETKWKVLYIDKLTKSVELISTNATSSKLSMSNKTGYINSKEILDNIGNVYGYGNGAIGGRSLNVNDIEYFSDFNPYEYKNVYSDTGCYGGNRAYDSGTFIMEDNKIIKATENNKVIMTQTSYYCAEKPHIKNKTIFDMIFLDENESYKENCYLNNRCVHLNEKFCYFIISGLKEGNITDDGIYHSSGIYNVMNKKVVPVINLRSGIGTTGQENNVWLLKEQ